MTEQMIPIPITVLRRALLKARREYINVAEREGYDPGLPWENWAEFERLAEYLNRREGKRDAGDHP